MILEYNNVEEITEEWKVRWPSQRLLASYNNRWGYFVDYLGSFGKVRLVKQKSTGKYMCVKIMKKEDIMKAQQVDHICNEYRILSSIRHPFIVRQRSLRSTSKDSLRIQETFTSLWNMFQEESSLLIFEKKVCSNPIKQRKV